ncbi:MAG: hypothetical protein VW985_00560 [Gammaproteobacteria bacterium]
MLLTLLLVALAGVSQLRLVDDMSASYINQTLQKSLITFAVARGLNGVVSVAQGTDLALEPAGVGVNLAIGEILDPVNDLIERFSWIMLASSTSLGIQAVLVELSAAKLIGLGVCGLSVLVAVRVWLPGRVSPTSWRLLCRGLVLLCFVRFTVVVIALANHQLSHYFLDDEIAASTQALQQTTERINQIEQNQQSDGKESPTSVTQRIQLFFGDVTSRLNAEKKLEHYKQAMSNAVNHIVRLAALFIVQTLLMPLLFLWGMVALLRYMLTRWGYPG